MKQLRRTLGSGVALLVASMGWVEPVPGQDARLALIASSPTPRLSADVARERTIAVFSEHCARCHQSGQTGGAVPAAALGNILALDDIAHDSALVDRGRPDASRLYQLLLTGHRPLDPFKSAPGGARPSAGDIEAVRDWIESLAPLDGSCPHRPPVREAELRRLQALWLEQFPRTAADTRFVTLTHLANACLSDRDIARYREEVTEALAALAPLRSRPVVESIGDQSTLLAFRLTDAGLSVEAWDNITAAAPRSFAGALPADWLAHHAGAPAAATLMRRYRDDVGLSRAAAEADVEERVLSARLTAIEGSFGRTAKQLRQWLVTRADWEQLDGHVKGRTPEADVGSPSALLRLGLWSDKAAYQPGEPVKITAMASGDCHLTLISIDRDGYATVLFPNDFDEDNLLRGGRPMTLPVGSSSYQLRTKEPGLESVAGICSGSRVRPEGIQHDFEGLRFTVLGNWRAFLRTAAEREAEIVKLGQPRSRRRAKSQPVSPSTAGPDTEARAAIYFEVR